MQQCRGFFAMKAIANLSWVLREHRAGCRLPPDLPAGSTNPVARRCSLKKSVQIHASSWRGRRCGVAQASFDHPRWCRSHPVCLWVALALGRGANFIKNSIFAIFSREVFPRIFNTAKIIQHRKKSYTTYETSLNKTWHIWHNIWLQIRQRALLGGH